MPEDAHRAPTSARRGLTGLGSEKKRRAVDMCIGARTGPAVELLDTGLEAIAVVYRLSACVRDAACACSAACTLKVEVIKFIIYTHQLDV